MGVDVRVVSSCRGARPIRDWRMGGTTEAAGSVRLVISDPSLQHLVETWVSDAGWTLATDENTPEQWAIVAEVAGLPGPDLLAKVRTWSEQHPERQLVLLVATTDRSWLTGDLAEMVYDVLSTPLAGATFLASLRRAREKWSLGQELQRLRSDLDGRHRVSAWSAQSPGMREVMRQVDRVLTSDITVAIFGESGTGKEMVARAIHHGGRRASGAFVAINCAALPEALHEPELFGHERGAFRGAPGVHRGRFEQADGGTLFLDEVGELSALTQASLLRALQERSVRRMGGVEEIPVDVRVVCTSQKDLEAEVRAGRFREDLYFRLVVYTLRLPPLRERGDDLPALIYQTLEKHSADVGRRVEAVAPEALRALTSYSWPGNVRELENVLHRAMLSTDGNRIELEHLPHDIQDRNLEVGEPDGGEVVPMRELERRAIQKALRATGGSVEKAAKLLGMGRATLYRRLAKYESLGREVKVNEGEGNGEG